VRGRRNKKNAKSASNISSDTHTFFLWFSQQAGGSGARFLLVAGVVLDKYVTLQK
jgi:hypothetical protein